MRRRLASTGPRHLQAAFARHGKALFINTRGACHTLADAGTGGFAGPALDSPWQASRVQEVITDGPGSMPSGLLTGQAAAQVPAATK